MANLGYPGKKHDGSDATELFLKVFGNEVLDAYLTKTFTRDACLFRQISNGKSATFPVIGAASAAHHTPGDSLIATTDGADMDHDERVVLIDKLMVSHVLVDDLDELMNYYDVRAPYSKQMGHALARQQDKYVLASMARAATLVGTSEEFDSATHPDGLEPKVIETTAGITSRGSITAAEIFAKVLELAQSLDENGVAQEDRYVVLPPAEYYTLLSHKDVISTDFSPEGNGSLGKGKIANVAGMTVIMSKDWEDTCVGSNTGMTDQRNSYSFTAENFVALAFQKEAAGTVALKDMSVESEYITERQGNLIVAKQATGSAVLRPEAIAALKLASA